MVDLHLDMPGQQRVEDLLRLRLVEVVDLRRTPVLVQFLDELCDREEALDDNSLLHHRLELVVDEVDSVDLSADKTDWFNVSYQTLFVGGIVVLAASVLVTLYLMGYLGGGSHPRAEAYRAIEDADRLLEQAVAASDDESLEGLRQEARTQLGAARQFFAESTFSSARQAAMESQQASRRVLAQAEGKEFIAAVQFYKIEGNVQVKKARQLIWKDADKKMPLDTGDQIKTGSSASASIGPKPCMPPRSCAPFMVRQPSPRRSWRCA